MSNSIQLTYVTFTNKEEADQLCDMLIHKKLIACYNLFEMESGYFWEGAFCNEDEVVAILKSIPSKAELIQKEIKGNHSYDIPCILSWQVSANKDYYAWICECMNLNS